MSASLSLVESNDLQYNEGRIEKGKAAFMEVADALMAIRDRKLYRAQFKTFEGYCVERWGFRRDYADKVIGGATAVKALPPELHTIVGNEATAREVAKVEPARREEVVREVAKRADAEDRKPTAKDVAEVAKEFVIDAPKRATPFRMPDRGLFIADGAIEQLKKIQPKDGERLEALARVRDWCSGQLITT